MQDENFLRSVVLVCDHDEEGGTVGFILNQPTNLVISDVIPDLPSEVDHPLFIGGPVSQETLHFIHTCPDRLSGGIDLSHGVWWGGNYEELIIHLAEGTLRHDEIKFFLGYSGWGPDQLAEEIEEQSWMRCHPYNPDLLFVINSENLWREALIAMGPKYASIANYPIDPRLN